MNSKTFKSKALSLCLVIATITTYSMVTLANPNKVVGEILVSNNTGFVKVNGEAVQNGHSVFSTSTIATPENTDAIVNFGTTGKVKLDSNSAINLSFDSENLTGTLINGKVTVMSSVNDVNTVINIGEVGKLKLAPNTSVALMFDGNKITGDLLAGEVIALNTNKTINIRTANGKISKLNTGDTAKAVQDDDDDDDDGGAAWIPWVLIFGGAAALIIWAAIGDNDRIVLGGGGTVISPTR